MECCLAITRNFRIRRFPMHYIVHSSSPLSLYLCAFFQGFRSLPRFCKLLQVQLLSLLKRLASAVQLRPRGRRVLRFGVLALARISLQSYGFSPKATSSVRLESSEPTVVGSFGPLNGFVPICKRSQNSEPTVAGSLRVPFPLSPPCFDNLRK